MTLSKDRSRRRKYVANRSILLHFKWNLISLNFILIHTQLVRGPGALLQPAAVATAAVAAGASQTSYSACRRSGR